MAPADFLFNIECKSESRNFKGNSASTPGSTFSIHCDNVDSFKDQIWLNISSCLKHEVITSTSLAIPSSPAIPADPAADPPIPASLEVAAVDSVTSYAFKNEAPVIGDLDRFITLFSETGRVTYALNKVTTAVLQVLNGKKCHVLVHIYGLGVSSASIFKIVKKTLLEPVNTDRSGATSEADVNLMVTTLKGIHCLNYRADYINWRLWAIAVLAIPLYDRNAMMQGAPPGTIIHLFSSTESDARIENTSIRQSYGVSIDQNQRHMSQLLSIKESMDICKRNQKRSWDEIDTRLNAAITRAENSRDLLESHERALPPTRISASNGFYNAVANADDFEHTEY